MPRRLRGGGGWSLIRGRILSLWHGNVKATPRLRQRSPPYSNLFKEGV